MAQSLRTGTSAPTTELQGPLLRHVVLAASDPLLDVLGAPHGLDVKVNNVVIVDPDDPVEAYAGDLVLLIGARGRDAAPLVRAAGHRGAAAVAVKVSHAEETVPLLRAAQDADVALLGVRPEMRWEQLEALCRSIVTDAFSIPETDLGGATGDLFSLAQTIATLSGGLVSIEDPSSRLLAYSGSSEDMDELRRLSVLGRQGPERFLTLLRQWGVFRRLRSGSDVVHVEEHPELGIRRRLAAGIQAGRQHLGTIWIQEGRTPLGERAEEALRGATRVVALHLLRSRLEGTASAWPWQGILADLLEGRAHAPSIADMVSVDPERPAAVAVFAARTHDQPRTTERSEAELVRRQLANLVEVHAAAYRKSALVTVLGTRIYALLPELDSAADGQEAAESGVPNLTRRIVAAARGLVDPSVQGAVGATRPSLHQVAESRAEADRVLDAMANDTSVEVAAIDDVRSRVLIADMVERVRSDPQLRDPRVTSLVEHDRRYGSELARSLRTHLECLGDVRAAAERLHIHPNTLRYRLRRVEAVSGIDLADPDQRLFANVQLLMHAAEP